MAKILLSMDEQKYLADADYLKKEVKRLEIGKNQLIGERDSLIKKNSDLKTQQIALEQRAKEIIAQAKEEARQIIDNAREVENKANQKRSEIEVKVAELDDAQKQLNNLIKSNEGREKSLEVELRDANSLKSKLITIVNTIKKDLGV